MMGGKFIEKNLNIRDEEHNSKFYTKFSTLIFLSNQTMVNEN